MKFVESLGAGVRVRPVAERPGAGSYWDLGSLRNSHVGAKRSLWSASFAEHIMHVRYHTLWAIYLKSPLHRVFHFASFVAVELIGDQKQSLR